MGVTPINSFDEFLDIINCGNVVVIDFWATWCSPCRQISPIFEALSNRPEYGDIGFYKVDVDEQPESSKRAEITAMPTFIIFKDGKRVKDLVGADRNGLPDLLDYAREFA